MPIINIKSSIVDNLTADFYASFGIDLVSPKSVDQALSSANSQDVTVNIASGGGDVNAGAEIYTMLRGYQGAVNVVIQGMAASAASVIAMAGKTIAMSPAALMMIHRASTISIGNKDDMEQTATVLQTVDRAIAETYQERTGLSQDELLNLMDQTTYMTAKDAVAKGFADKILDNQQVPQMVNSTFPILSHDAIMQLKTQSKVVETKQAKNSQPTLMQRKLAILTEEK